MDGTAPAQSFMQLVVWQKAHAFVLAIYQKTAGFPRTEIYGLTSQIRRAAVSIPANIAEGFKRRGKSDKARFLNMAQSSLEETRYYLVLAKDLRFVADDELIVQIEEVSRLLNAYERRVLASAR